MKLTPEVLAEARRQLAASGGAATARKRTAAQRSEAARKAVEARWAKARTVKPDTHQCEDEVAAEGPIEKSATHRKTR